jgi:hypothetical protein
LPFIASTSFIKDSIHVPGLKPPAFSLLTALKRNALSRTLCLCAGVIF